MTTLSDPRRRRLAVLGGATLLFVGLAVAAVVVTGSERGPKFEPRPLFPGLSGQANTVGEIAIEDKTGGFHVRKVDGKWGIPERNLFPADASQVRAAVVGIANMEIVQAKTANKDYWAALGLSPPDTGGDAVRMTVYDETGKKTLADVLIGKSDATADVEGRSTRYVRKPGEAQAWLARGYLTPKPSIADWLDKNIPSVTRDRIRLARLTPVAGTAYSVSREKNTDENFTLANIPAGKELSYPGAANTVALAITDFPFDDVRPQSEVNFSKAAILVTETFDGLSLEVKTADKDGAAFATLSAQALKQEAAKDADAINARTRGWAFKLPGYKAELFRTPRDTLLKK